MMNESFEDAARSKLTKLVAATLACSVFCFIPNGLFATLGYIGINVLVIFAFIFYRNRMKYSDIEYLYSGNRYIYRTIFWGCLWFNLLGAVFCGGVVYFIISNMDQFQVMFQELMSDIPADLMNSVRNGAQLSDADNEKLMTAVMSVYKAHQNEIKDMFLSYSFILFIVLPFFSIIIPVIWMVFRSVRALNALSKRKDVYTGRIYDGNPGKYTQEA